MSVCTAELRAYKETRSPWKDYILIVVSITREASIKTTWVGKKPGHRPGKLSWEAAPFDVWATNHGGQGALSEKDDRTRCVMSHLGFKSESGLSKFLRRDLASPF
jgi:hypothetical protein